MTRSPAIPESVRNALRSALPGADTSAAVFLAEGISSRAFRVMVCGSVWIVRVPTDYPQPWRWGGGRSFEAPWLRYLVSLGLPVPGDAFSLDDPVTGLPRVLVTREVEGAPMTDLPSDAGPITDQLAAFLRTLHSVPARSAVRLGLPTRSMVSVLEEAFHRVAPVLADKESAWVRSKLERLEELVPDPVPIHGDFRGEHWFVDCSHDLVGVIDFGDSALSDPAIDLARCADQFGPAFRDDLISAYGGGVQLRERVILYEMLQPLIELDGSEDVEWWNRAEALTALRKQIDG